MVPTLSVLQPILLNTELCVADIYEKMHIHSFQRLLFNISKYIKIFL